MTIISITIKQINMILHLENVYLLQKLSWKNPLGSLKLLDLSLEDCKKINSLNWRLMKSKNLLDEKWGEWEQLCVWNFGQQFLIEPFIYRSILKSVSTFDKKSIHDLYRESTGASITLLTGDADFRFMKA